MKAKTLLTVVAIGATLTLAARADLFEDFDNLTVGPLNGQNGWTVATAGAINVTAATSVSAPNSAVWGSSVAAQARKSMPSIDANLLDWSFDFNNVGATRDFNALYGYSGGWGVGLTVTLQMGDYNLAPTSLWQARWSSISGAQFGDGAVQLTTSGWFSLNKARSTGWHNFEVIGGNDPINAGKLKLNFYIDGGLVGSVANLNNTYLNWACVGSAVSVGITGGNTDNFSVSTIPEPSSIALCLIGGLALAGGAISRRRA